VYEAGSFTEAVKVAELQMESAKAMGFGNIPADSGTVDGIYQYSTTVQSVGDRLDQIAVNVQWRESGNPRTVTVTNRISDR